MSKTIEIFERPKHQRYWVVRCNGGNYFEHFCRASIIAISHLDWLKIPKETEGIYDPNLEDLKENFQKYYETRNRTKATFTSHFNQVKNFIFEMKPGDLVLTIGQNEIKIGRIIGLPVFERKQIEIIQDVENDKRSVMNSYLRRRVSWGPSIRRSDMPHSLIQSFRANQAVFNLDDQWEYIYHMIYPFFKDQNLIYFTTLIKQTKSIDNFSVSQFFTLLSELEVFSEEFDAICSPTNNVNFEELFLQYAYSNCLNLTSKAQFMSMGSILGKLDIKTAKSFAVFFFAYSAVFGSDKLGWDGILDLETRHKIRDFVSDRLEKNHGEMMKENLQLGLPEYETQALEDSSQDGISKIEAGIISI